MSKNIWTTIAMVTIRFPSNPSGTNNLFSVTLVSFIQVICTFTFVLLWRQRNRAPLRDHFVRPSVRLSVVCTFRLSHFWFAYNFLAHLSRRLEWAIVIAHRPSSVRPSSARPSVRKLFTFSTSSPEPLDGFWWNLVGMKYSWSLTSVVVFRPDPPGADPGPGPKLVTGSPSLRNFFFRPEGYSDKPNA